MKETATRRGRSYPASTPWFILEEIRQENEILGIEGPSQVGKRASELRGKERRTAEFYEKQLREETVEQRIKRLGAAIKARRKGRR